MRYFASSMSKSTFLVMYSSVSNNRTSSIKRTGKIDFIWLAKKDNLMLLLMENDQTFGINLNALHVNGMTRFDLPRRTYGY